MDERRSDGPVLVAVEDPEHVQQLVRTAGDLARFGSGSVRIVTVVAKPHDSPFGIFDDDTIRREFGGDSRQLIERASVPEGVTVERDVIVDRSVARGLLAAVAESDPAALVVGWRERSGTDAVLGTTVDTLVERAACDLYVERVGREADGVDSVLLPVAGESHVGVAARVVAAIAARNDARVVVLSVTTADVGRDEAAAFVAEGRDAVETAVDAGAAVGAVETTVREAADATAGIVDAAADHDVVVLGATRRGALRRLLVGSVAQRIVDRTDRTVILGRDGETVGGPLGRLGALLRR